MFKLALLALVAVTLANVATAVTDGEVIQNQQAPYIVQLRTKWGDFLCSGTLVAPHYVVTAAHCLQHMNKEEVMVFGGVSSNPETEEKRGIEKWQIHPDFSSTTLNMDVAVIKVFREMKGKDIEPAALCAAPLKEKDIVQVVGWGKFNENKDLPEGLRSVSVPVISRADCVAKYADTLPKLTESMVCASEPGTKDVCIGDAGGPAIRDGELCGVFSWSVGCGRPEYPGVYTDVAAVRKFIDYAMKN